MKFSEKLQTLRKNKKMSQEQLADLMEVSRQSVSKWESGQAYPEMDKLLMLCKIFDCSLDDLTNDEVTEIKVNKNMKINASTLVDQFLKIIKDCYYCITNMKANEVIRMILEMIILIIIIRFIGFPFEFIANKVKYIFLNSNFFLTDVFGYLFYSVIIIIYTILAVIIVCYIFKLRYLDCYEPKETPIEKDNIKEDMKDNNSSKEKENVIIVKDNNHSIINFLVNIVIGFIKIIIGFISIGLVFTIVGLSTALAIFMIGAFNKILFVGIIIGLIASIVICANLIEMAFYFIFNHKVSLPRILITSLISLIVIGIGIGISFFDMTKYEYIDSLPKTAKVEINKDEYVYKDNMYIDYYNYSMGIDSVVYEIDNTIPNDKFIIEYKSSKYMDLSVTNENNIIEIYRNYHLTGQEVFKEVLENLKDKKIYSYNIYEKVKIIGGEEVIAKLKDNHKRIIDERIRQNNYYHEIEEEKYLEIIDDLNEENTRIKNELEEATEELERYKNKISELID